MRNLVYGAALSIVGLLVVMFVYPLSNAQRHFDLDAVPTDSPRTVLIPLPSNGFDPTEGKVSAAVQVLCTSHTRWVQWLFLGESSRASSTALCLPRLTVNLAEERTPTR